MTKSDLLTQIAKRAHCDGYDYNDSSGVYYNQVKDAFREAINELALTVPLSDVQYLVKSASYTVTSNKIILPSNFAQLIFIESTNARRSFVLVDISLWQKLLVGDSDFDPPQGVVYYYINGSDVLFHNDVNGVAISVKYLAAAYPDSWDDDFELTQIIDRFTEKFVTLVKNRAVQILTAVLRGEMQ